MIPVDSLSLSLCMSMYFYLESQLDKLASCFFANEVREYESGEGSLPNR